MVTWKNSTKDITMGQCLKCEENNLNVIINDGKNVSFEIEFDDYDD